VRLQDGLRAYLQPPRFSIANILLAQKFKHVMCKDIWRTTEARFVLLETSGDINPPHFSIIP
jgi:hypothetical protein